MPKKEHLSRQVLPDYGPIEGPEKEQADISDSDWPMEGEGFPIPESKEDEASSTELR